MAETSGNGNVVVLELTQATRIDHVITMENIVEGERVREYVVEGLVGEQWQELCRGTSIGHKKIDQFSPKEVTKIRWRCLKSVAEPRIRRLAVYAVNGPKAASDRLTTEQATAALERDWLFQAMGEPLLARTAKEIGWTRELAARLRSSHPSLNADILALM